MGTPKFGTAGAGELFYEKGGKHSYEVPAFLQTMNLQAFEYQCGRGVNMGEEKARLLGEKAKACEVALSIHAPYYISLAVEEEERRQKNAGYFLQSAGLAKAMGAERIVFHPGGVAKMTREKALALAIETLRPILKELNDAGFGEIIFCPETMGKINQLGDLSETLSLCKLQENMLPCIDFGHLNARTGGGLKTIDDYARIFTQIENELGAGKAARIHCHFSKIEYSQGGEKKHLTFADTVFGPDYEPLMELLYKKNYAPVIICESDGTQAEDAAAMRAEYEKWATKLL
jgi:deoxyribonuclease-4